MKSINPTTNEVIREYSEHSSSEVKTIIEDVHTEWLTWKETSFEHRSGLLRNAARILRERKETYARLMTEEMARSSGNRRPRLRNVPMPATIMQIMRLSCWKTRSFLQMHRAAL